jgi:dienelactone hydrolase
MRRLLDQPKEQPRHRVLPPLWLQTHQSTQLYAGHRRADGPDYAQGLMSRRCFPVESKRSGDLWLKELLGFVLRMSNSRSAQVKLCCGQVAGWLVFVLLLTSCTLDSEQKTTVLLPTGHYEGALSYQGTELQAVLDLRESQPGQLEADLHFPEIEGLGFPAVNLSYTEPQLRFEEATQPGGMAVTALREGDFLRGVFTLDSAKVDFVWVRRGQPEPRSYQQKQLAAPPRAGGQALTLFVPNDTTKQHAAVALFTDAAHLSAVTGRASKLADHGFITTVVAVTPTASLPDSATLRTAAAVLLALRSAPRVDTTRIGLWAHKATAAAIVPAAVGSRAAFVVLENVPVASAEDAKPFQLLARQRVPVLGLYAAADTSLNARESARRLRKAVGSRRGSLVRLFPQADANFRVPGGLNDDGKWTWPRPATGYIEAVREWRK